MSGIRIVTDSTADLPAGVAEQLGIMVVPLKVLFGTQVYRDGIDLDTKEFYQRLQSEMSMSAHPSPVDFLDVYEKCVGQKESIISIHISSHLSATLESARSAKEMSGYEDITIIDSLSASSGLGLMVIAAARAAGAGKSKEEIIKLVLEIRDRMKIFFVVDTLDYLVRGGRIGRFEGFMGSLLGIKPILTIEGGVILPVAKIMGKARALEKMLNLVKNDNPPSQNLYCSLIHGGDNASIDGLKPVVEGNFKCRELICSEFGPVIGTHVGPRVIGMAYYAI